MSQPSNYWPPCILVCITNDFLGYNMCNPVDVCTVSQKRKKDLGITGSLIIHNIGIAVYTLRFISHFVAVHVRI